MADEKRIDQLPDATDVEGDDYLLIQDTSAASTRRLRIDQAQAALVDTASIAAAGAVLDGDPRLSDARTPTAHGATHVPGGADAIPPVPPILWMGGDLTLTPEHHGQAIYIVDSTTIYVPGSLPEGTTVALIRGEGPFGPVPIQSDPSDPVFLRRPSGFERALASEAGAIACLYMVGTLGFPVEPGATIFGNLEPEPAP